MNDKIEVKYNLNPKFNDANYDNDGDGIKNIQEVNNYKTDPNLSRY